MLEGLTKFARNLAQRGDLVVALIMLTAVVMMIIPLPTLLVDIIIAVNITLGLLILLVGFYISSPAQFSSLPAVILIATVFRLAISITTTRLILLQADAGDVVRTFGEFVVGGNVAVGIIIFFIITIAQFVVITKGGERVAEVAARFTLDAMPGKQMAIDNELRNGDITQQEARSLRRALERESNLYGAMDGAMKFVKGDAIAGLIIVFVNLIGGLAVGVMQHGLPFAQAVQTYSLLTIGDGLVSQIPALLVSLGAGTVVTRVATDGGSDLSSDIISQLFGDVRALYLSGSILAGLSFMPGFPTLVFLFLAAGLFAGGWLVQRRHAAARDQATLKLPAELHSKPQGDTARTVSHPLPGHSIVVRVGSELGNGLRGELFTERSEAARSGLMEDLGVSAPMVELRIDVGLERQRFGIDLQDVPVAEGEILTDDLLVVGNSVNLDLAEIPYRRGAPLLEPADTIWVNKAHKGDLVHAGVTFMTPAQVLGRCLAKTLKRYALHFVGIQETRAILTRAEGEFGDLIKEAQNSIPIQKIAEIMRRLVEEDVPIRNVRLILEAIVEFAPKEKEVVFLGEYVRMALGRQICFRVADPNRIIAAYVLERAVEEALRGAIRSTAVGTFFSLPETTARPIINQFRRALSETKGDVLPVALTTMDVRRHLRNLLRHNSIDLPVLSYQELTTEFSVQPLATIVADLPALPERTELGRAQDRAASEEFS